MELSLGHRHWGLAYIFFACLCKAWFRLPEGKCCKCKENPWGRRLVLDSWWIQGGHILIMSWMTVSLLKGSTFTLYGSAPDPNIIHHFYLNKLRYIKKKRGRVIRWPKVIHWKIKVTFLHSIFIPNVSNNVQPRKIHTFNQANDAVYLLLKLLGKQQITCQTDIVRIKL